MLLRLVDVGHGAEGGSAAAGGSEGEAAESVAVDVEEDDVVGVGDAAFVDAAFEALEEAVEVEAGDGLGLGAFGEVEDLGEAFGAVEGGAPSVDEVVDDGGEGGLGAAAGVGAFEATDGG